jgi:hypothetical protein
MMNSPRMTGDRNVNADVYETNNSSLLSGVSWSAIFAGAAGAFSLSLVLLTLGIGLGLTTLSPWDGKGVSPTGVGISALLWLAVTQIMASIVGGYLAGRLRVKWVKVHDDEVFFRDTAHGFIAWSIATLGAAFFFVMPLVAIVNNGAHAAATASGQALATGSVALASGTTATPSTLNYSIDSLFRVDPKTKPASATTDNGEVIRIFAADLITGTLPPEDKSYVAQVVAARTGTSQADAEQRVSNLFTNIVNAEMNIKQKAKETADAARKAAAHAALWTVIALFAGAFCASFAATFGGKLRDKIA